MMHEGRWLGAGVLLSALIFVPSRWDSPENFVVPKELALHAAALLGLAIVLVRARPLTASRIEAVILAALLLSVGAFSAVQYNRWWAFRALSLSISAAVVFWTARSVRDAGAVAAVLTWSALAAGALALMVLLEAHGVIPRISMAGRGPAGAGGNRNFTAHLLVLSLPALWLAIARLEATRMQRTLATCAAGLVSAAVVMSRARAAWLAGIVALAIIIVSALRMHDRKTTISVGLVAGALLLGLLVAQLPARGISWREPSPYRNTLAGLLDLKAGTGRGRLIQYENTLKMIAAHPLLGVGPGRWSLIYPEFATAGDPSFRPATPRSVNRLPNSDWIGIASERGLAVLVLVVVAGVLIARVAWRILSSKAATTHTSVRLTAVTLIATLAAALVLGTFDAVLLRPEPAFYLAVMVGFWYGSLENESRPLGLRVRRIGLAGIGIILAISIAETGMRGLALPLRRSGTVADLERALDLDRGNYALAAELAMTEAQAGHCGEARQHYERAFALNRNVSRSLPGLSGCSIGLSAK
jgi:O-antigen ligase